jgi:thymidylate synthase (FAD)
MIVKPIAVSTYIGTYLGTNALKPEELMMAIARVSSDREPEKRGENITGLLKHCFNNKHWSVFDMVDMTIYIQTSLPIAMQMLRHQSFKFQMFSQRYQEVGGVENIEFRKRGGSDRQGSLDEIVNLPIEVKENIINSIQNSIDAYNILLQNGVSLETARFVLPLCTKTELFVKGSVRSWIHYLEQRLDKHAQKEHRLIAKEIYKIFSEYFPITSKLISQNDNE